MVAMSKLASAVARPQFDYINFGFGLDLITPSIKTVPGSLRESQNYEIDINGGYTGCIGYERFDGQEKPSDANYARLDITISGSFSVGDAITGVTSSATATVIAVNTTFDVSQAFLVITKITGTFQSGENIQVSAVTEGTADGTHIIDGAPTIKLAAQYKNLAADEYRGDIAAVPGSGNILGIWMLNDVKYAFRNNVGGTEADLYKSTSSGWSQVSLGLRLSFTSGGTTEIVVGDVIDGLISGASATITGVSLESGSWAAGTAAGTFIFASQTGNFQAEGVEIAGSGDLATIASDSSAITLLPSGRYEFVTHNFGGQIGTKKMYGCDGVNKGFEFDGTTYIPITTGMTVDTPSHLAIFKNHLFFSFGGSAQHSGIGTPYTFTVITGAAELAVGDNITAFEVQPGAEGDGSLAILSRNRIHILYGTSSADWNLVQYRKEIGSYEHSVQEFGMTMMLDDRGVATLQTVQAYGNFKNNTESRLIQPWVNERKAKVNASCIARDKSQYRLFFSDNYALYVTTNNNKVVGMMPQLFPDTVECIFSLEASNGDEEILFGSDNGMVYQLEKGTSFDGDPIERIMVLHFHHSKSPRVIKRYLDAVMEISGFGYAEFNFAYELNYNKPTTPQPQQQLLTANFSETRWDSFTWDAFFWDGTVLTPTDAKMEGSGENVSFIFRSNSDYFHPLTFSGVQLQFNRRRNLR